MNTHKNHLANETSPYLQQHADNPVDWYPWGEEALKKAKETNKPILLSIGYSACHWCHVMAHESFEDEKTAELMNRLFINIKVDREERPDLDKIYQTALQILTHKSGGWPLTMFLTPDEHIPFFGGTYFPKRAGFGSASFKEVLQNVADHFQTHPKELKSFSVEFQNALQRLSETTVDKSLKLNDEPLRVVRQKFNDSFDRVNGGFGGAPKFPLTTQLESLLQTWQAGKKRGEEDTEARTMVELSLEKMARGGLYDQLGGGFYRYCVDVAWIIPHFEKMLYDNAQLLPLYVHAAIATNNTLFKNTAITTAEWIIREMQSSEGAYYSTINADSEGEEGKFYYWDRDEIKAILSADEYAVIEKYFALDLPANFENHWHLQAPKALEDIASECNIDIDKAITLRKQAMATLYKIRDKRVHPDRDKKILTGWNGLMIKAMYIAGSHLKRPDFIASADQALDFIYKNLRDNQRLFATYKDGRAHLMAYLDDYAFMLEAVIQSLQTKWSDRYCQFAIELAEALCQYFFDEEQGGFYFTAHDHEALIQRQKPILDNATPAGNGIAAKAFLRLGYLLGNQRYLDVAQRTLQMAWQKIHEYPTACNSVLLSLEEVLTPPTIIILRGDPDELASWQEAFYSHYLPHHLCFAIPNNAVNLPESLQKPSEKAGVVAYLCQGWECRATAHSLEEFVWDVILQFNGSK